MNTHQNRHVTIDAYIVAFPPEIQTKLSELRAAVQSAAPDANETISYQMPAFAQHGILVYFAVWKEHVGFYPTSSGMRAFESELSNYECSKGAVRFPIDKPLPLDLIRRIVEFRVEENVKKAEVKARKHK
jgi:uncharacterized protein YdhG (YjbR/CyaY superfamily)